MLFSLKIVKIKKQNQIKALTALFFHSTRTFSRTEKNIAQSVFLYMRTTVSFLGPFWSTLPQNTSHRGLLSPSSFMCTFKEQDSIQWGTKRGVQPWYYSNKIPLWKIFHGFQNNSHSPNKNSSDFLALKIFHETSISLTFHYSSQGTLSEILANWISAPHLHILLLLLVITNMHMYSINLSLHV